MPTEQQELQLKVTLEDEASDQLAAIRKAIGALGGGGRGGGGGGGHPVSGGHELNKALEELAHRFLHVGHAAFEFAKQWGPIGVGLGGLGVAVHKLSEASEEFARAGTNLSNSARLAGASVGDLAAVIGAFKRVGQGAEQTTQMMINLNQAYGELSRAGSARQRELMEVAGFKNIAQMQQLIVAYGRTTDSIARLNIARNAAMEAARRDFAEHSNLAHAAYVRDRVLALMGAPELALLDEQIKAFSKERQENMKAEEKTSRDLLAAKEDIAEAQHRLNEIVKAASAPWDLWKAKQSARFWEWLATNAEARENYNLKHPNQSMWRPIGSEDVPGTTPLIGWKGSPGLYAAGGPTSQAGQHPDALSAKGGAHKPLPFGQFTGGQEVRATDEHTSQLGRLTQNIIKLLSDPDRINLGAIDIKKYQKGGTAGNSQVAMVAEGDSPEAVSNVHGTRVYDQPSIGMLKAGERVTPLNIPDRNKNPGNIKKGPESIAYGAIGYDEKGHAIFSSWEAGYAAQGALLARKYAGKSIEDIGGHGKGYAEDKNWAAGVTKLGGYSSMKEVPDLSTPEGLLRFQAASQKQEGGHMPPLDPDKLAAVRATASLAPVAPMVERSSPVATGGRAGASGGAGAGEVPTQSAAGQNVHLQSLVSMIPPGADKQDVQDYMKKNGINWNIATCAQFLTSRIKNEGGVVPPPSTDPNVHPAWVASNYNDPNVGSPGYSNDPNAINFLVRQGTPEGQGGSHVTTANPKFDAAGNFVGYKGLGVNQVVVNGVATERHVLSNIPIDIGTGPKQYAVRHQIADPNARDPAQEMGGLRDDQSIRVAASASLIEQYPDRGFHGGGGDTGGAGATGSYSEPYQPGGQVFENLNAMPPERPLIRDLKRYTMGAVRALTSSAYDPGAMPSPPLISLPNQSQIPFQSIGVALSGSGILEDFNKPAPLDAAEIMRRRGLPVIPPGGVHDPASTLDALQGHSEGAPEVNIRIEHDNPPHGTEVSTDGKAFENSTKETTVQPAFDTSANAPWRHPSAADKARQRQSEVEGRKFDATHPEYGAGGIRG